MHIERNTRRNLSSPHRQCNRQVRAIIDSPERDRLANPPPDDTRFMQRRARQKNREFLAANASSDITWAQIPFQPMGNFSQASITNGVPSFVIDLLKVINIEHHQT